MPTLTDLVARNLPILRNRRGISQEALAREIGKSKQTVWAYENAQGGMTASTISKLAGALGCEESDLVAESPAALTQPARLLSPLEVELLSLFSKLGEKEQLGLVGTLRGMVGKQKSKKLEDEP